MKVGWGLLRQCALPGRAVRARLPAQSLWRLPEKQDFANYPRSCTNGARVQCHYTWCVKRAARPAQRRRHALPLLTARMQAEPTPKQQQAQSGWRAFNGLIHNKPKYGSELAAQCFAVAWQTANCCELANKAGRRRRQLPAFLAGAGALPANGSGCCAPAPPTKKVSRETRRWYAGGRALFCSTAPRKYFCDRDLFQRAATPAFVYLAQACVSRETFARARHGRGYAVRSATSSSSPVRGSVPDFMATSSCARRA